MRGGSAQRAQHVEAGHHSRTNAMPNRRRPAPRRDDAAVKWPARYRDARSPKGASLYRRRRTLAVSVVLLGILALVLAAFAQTSGTRDRALPIDPNNAVPEVWLAEVAGVGISSPIRPEKLTGLGYHPEGESLV